MDFSLQLRATLLKVLSQHFFNSCAKRRCAWKQGSAFGKPQLIRQCCGSNILGSVELSEFFTQQTEFLWEQSRHLRVLVQILGSISAK
jgi:hypothetical protein